MKKLETAEASDLSGFFFYSKTKLSKIQGLIFAIISNS